MRNAPEWIQLKTRPTEHRVITDRFSIHDIRAIQADALEHAASLIVSDGNPELAKLRILNYAHSLKHQ